MKNKPIFAAEIITQEQNIPEHKPSIRSTVSYNENIEILENNIFLKFNTLVTNMINEKRKNIQISSEDCIKLQTYIINLKENIEIYQNKINVLNDKVISSQETITVKMNGGTF